MDYSNRLNISYYKTIAVINETHKVFLVQHQDTKKIYIKKILDVYNFQIYTHLQQNNIIGIPQVIDMYEENNQLTIIEQFVSGTSLQEMMLAKELSVTSLAHYMCELCDILENLHSLHPPIVHRDIKPSNIMITYHDHVMLIDFNAAKYLTDAASSDTVLLGTKGYAAPEQYGFGSSTPQTDIYALGILLKELVSTLSVPTEQFTEIIHKCTQINPSDRFESVKALKAEIEKLNKIPAISPPASFTWKSLIPPGYRTLTPWKMAIATVMYIFIASICLPMEFKDSSGLELWIERIFALYILLSPIFCLFNYCDIQRFSPLCKSKNWMMHCIGILLLNAAIVVLLFMVMLSLMLILSLF